MGQSIDTSTIIIAERTQIEKLFCTLDVLPEMMILGKMQKSFLSNPIYAEKVDMHGASSFSMDDVFIGNAKNLDDSLINFHYLYVDSNGYNGEWIPSTFMSYNGIGYEWIVKSTWNDAFPISTQYYVENQSTRHYECMSFDDPKYIVYTKRENKPTEFISYGMELIGTVKNLKADENFRQRNEMYKRRLATENAINQLE